MVIKLNEELDEYKSYKIKKFMEEEHISKEDILKYFDTYDDKFKQESEKYKSEVRSLLDSIDSKLPILQSLMDLIKEKVDSTKSRSYKFSRTLEREYYDETPVRIKFYIEYDRVNQNFDSYFIADGNVILFRIDVNPKGVVKLDYDVERFLEGSFNQFNRGIRLYPKFLKSCIKNLDKFNEIYDAVAADLNRKYNRR